MRITESRLRRIIRSVIKESGGFDQETYDIGKEEYCYNLVNKINDLLELASDGVSIRLKEFLQGRLEKSIFERLEAEINFAADDNFRLHGSAQPTRDFVNHIRAIINNHI